MSQVRLLTRPLLTFCPFLCLAACAVDEDVSRELSRSYGRCRAAAVDPRHLTVTCRDSPFAARPHAEGEVTARKVAQYVRDHHPKYKGAEDVTVAFMDKKETEASVEPDHAKARYVFTAAELGPPRP